MRLKGVSYDVGRVLGMNWRPVFDPDVVHRELAIIKTDPHCNAVRDGGVELAFDTTPFSWIRQPARVR
jgi:hypothetical protein